MSKKVDDFVKAFVSLSDSEKRQVFQMVKVMETGSLQEKRFITDSVGLESLSTTVNFAPTPGGCPACGR